MKGVIFLLLALVYGVSELHCFPGSHDVDRGGVDVTSGDANMTSSDANMTSADADTNSGDANMTSADANTNSGDANMTSADANTNSGDANMTSTDSNTNSGDANMTRDGANETSADANTNNGDANMTSADPNTNNGDANITIDDANITIDDANITIEDTNITIDDANMTSDGANETCGGANETSGDAKVTSRNADVASGDANMTSGDANMTSDGANVASRNAVIANEEIANRLIDSKPDIEWRFKYAVALYLSNGTIDDYKCTASIIGPKTVLTAAHCVNYSKNQTENSMYGMVGSTERTLGRRVNFTEIIPHPRYDEDTLRNDIAILKSAENITADDAIQACIANRSTKIDQYKYATAMEWGRTNKDLSEGPQVADHLHYVEMELNKHTLCKMRYPDKVTEMQLCGDGYGKDTCVSDYGGPLSHVSKGQKDIVIGISSFGATDKCGSTFVEPNVYTRAASYEEWITKTAGEDAKNICVM